MEVKTHYLDDISILLKNNEKCNFIAFAMTPLHAHGVDAVIKFLNDTVGEVNGYIYIIPHPITGRLLTEKNFVNNYSNIVLVNGSITFSRNRNMGNKIFDRIKALYNVKKGNGKTIYVVATEMIPALFSVINKAIDKPAIKFIKIDDGAGSYLNPIEDKLSYVRSQYGKDKNVISYVKGICKALAYCQYMSLLLYNIKSSNKYIDANIFIYHNVDNNKYFTSNSMISPYYKMVFKELGKNIPKDKLTIFNESVLFNTQCLAECNMTDGVIDLELYKEVISICNKYNKKVILKPHPREKNINKYKELGIVLLENKNYSQEILFACLDKMPYCVISIFSSTLLNAVGIYNIPAISLAKIMLNKKIDHSLSEQLKEYITQYEKLIIFPNSVEDLESIICKIKRN